MGDPLLPPHHDYTTPVTHIGTLADNNGDRRNRAALTQLLSQRSSKSFVVGEETDRQICTLWRSRPLTRGQAHARHSSLQQPAEGGVARHARGGARARARDGRLTASHKALSVTLDLSSPPSTVLCRAQPRPPASELKPESRGLCKDPQNSPF